MYIEKNKQFENSINKPLDSPLTVKFSSSSNQLLHLSSGSSSGSSLIPKSNQQQISSSPSYHQNNNAKSLADIETNIEESPTSTSVFHGVILIAIIIISLAAFIFSKIQRLCNEQDVFNSDCPIAIILLYSIITILSCLTSFAIYFFHLIGQCDAFWLKKRKFAIEISFIFLMITSLTMSIILVMTKTEIQDTRFGLISVGCSMLAIIGYVIRMIMICYEFLKKNIIIAKIRKQDSYKKPMLPRLSKYSFNNTSIQSTRAISYVRPKTTDNSQKTNDNNIESNFTEIELDDDVFQY